MALLHFIAIVLLLRKVVVQIFPLRFLLVVHRLKETRISVRFFSIGREWCGRRIKENTARFDLISKKTLSILLTGVQSN